MEVLKMEYGVLTFSAYHQGDSYIRLNYVEVYNLKTKERSFFNGSLRNIFEGLTACGLDYIYILNAPEFFGFIDYFATVERLFYYDDLKDDSGQRKRITKEAWTVKEGVGQSYSRKIWLYSTKGNTRHKRLHSVSFMNFSPMVGGLSLQELIDAFSRCRTGDSLEDFATCLKAFDELFERITGQKFLGEKFPAAWTMGGAARNYYLRLRYPNATSRLKLYQISHPQNINFEYQLREDKLLMPGLLYAYKRKILLNTPGLKKYDVNSLFAATERDLPDLGKFEECSFKDYNQITRKKYEFIFIIQSLVLKRKKDMPGVFCSPFETYESNNDYITISQEWAVFAPFLEALKNFYDIVEMEITSVYRAAKYTDPAIMKYVDSLDKLKATARKQHNKGLATIVKFLIVNLHGKFAQKTVSEEVRFEYDSKQDIIIKQETDDIKEEWENKHFDYIRGAYIYTMARVRIMEIILRFKEVLASGGMLVEHIFYDDTDSIVTDLTAPADIVDSFKLGKLRLEEEYETFEVIAPKTYWGRTLNNEIKLVCAGLDKKEVFTQIENEFKVPLKLMTDYSIHKLLTNEERVYYIPILTRIRGGNGYISIPRALTSKNKSKILL